MGQKCSCLRNGVSKLILFPEYLETTWTVDIYVAG